MTHNDCLQNPCKVFLWQYLGSAKIVSAVRSASRHDAAQLGLHRDTKQTQIIRSGMFGGAERNLFTAKSGNLAGW